MRDIAIVGGGINGCGIARDAAGRGLSVVLFEKGDLGGATSSASTKLVHGGLRYLEYYEFRLVREALMEREVLWRAAPHIIWPLRFVLPYDTGLRPSWLIRAGLFLYDNIGGRERLPGTSTLDLTRDPAGMPLKPRFTRGFEYSDCWVEDARLVVLNAQDASARGAEIRVRTELTAARREAGHWVLDVRDAGTGRAEEVRARTLVNAAGPWVSEVAANRVGAQADARVRLVKGSHIVVPRIFSHDKAYIFQNADGRIVFAIPFEQDFTLIGTTDRDHGADPGAPKISEEEIRYLCSAASEYFRAPVTPGMVVHTYSGVRPLYDDGARNAQAATRDYVLQLDEEGKPPILNIYGGKITTYRRLAEAALARLKPHLPAMGAAWTRDAPLPGGDFPVDGFPALAESLAQAAPMLGPDHARRLARAYGTRAKEIVAGVRAPADWGRRFGHDLAEREVRYLMDEEWAQTAEDVLWRRSKLGLRLTADQASELDTWMRLRADRASEPERLRAGAGGS
jgi:glycerol-3-phosphate dehydrogenase